MVNCYSCQIFRQIAPDPSIIDVTSHRRESRGKGFCDNLYKPTKKNQGREGQ